MECWLLDMEWYAVLEAHASADMLAFAVLVSKACGNRELWLPCL